MRHLDEAIAFLAYGCPLLINMVDHVDRVKILDDRAQFSITDEGFIAQTLIDNDRQLPVWIFLHLDILESECEKLVTLVYGDQY
mgnify:CR=1 FL=1